jgi:hypothetical protein
MQKDDLICNMGRLGDGRWIWELHWRRNLFVWEEEQYNALIEIIAPFMPSG